MANVVPKSWRNRTFRANEERASWQSGVEVLPAHEGETISSHKAQQVNRVRYQRYVASLDQLPEEAGPSDSNDVFGESRQRSCQGPATEPIGTRHCRLFEGEVCGPDTNNNGFGVRVYRTALPGNGGTPSGEVPLLRSDGCQHASRAHMPLIRRTGKPASAASTRAVPHLQAVFHPPSSGKRSAL